MGFHSDSAQVFLAVLDAGSFSAAARALGRVPSAVSMAIAQLEAELDLELFDRRGREPRPTDAARALEPQARLLADQLQRLNTQALSLTQGLEERLTLAITPELLASAWAAPLAALAERYPALQVEVLTAPQEDTLAMLHEGRAQLALVFERPSLDGRESFQEVGLETLIAVVAPKHPLLNRSAPPATGDGVELPDPGWLEQTRQIVVASRDPSQTDHRFVMARHFWRTDNHLAALGLIEAGLGWGWQPRALVQPRIAAGSLTELRFAQLSTSTRLWVDVVWSKQRPLGLAARAFVQLMHEAGGSPDLRSAPPG